MHKQWQSTGIQPCKGSRLKTMYHVSCLWCQSYLRMTCTSNMSKVPCSFCLNLWHCMYEYCAPNTRVLTSQGSWIEIENIIQAFLSAAGGCSEMSVCFPLSIYTPARNASIFWYSILTSFNTILIPCLLVLFSLNVLHSYSLNACL